MYEPKCPECGNWQGHAGDCISRPDYREPKAQEHEWMPAGVTTAPQNENVTYVWGMCKCGEIMMRQWDL